MLLLSLKYFSTHKMSLFRPLGSVKTLVLALYLALYCFLSESPCYSPDRKGTGEQNIGLLSKQVEVGYNLQYNV